MPAKTLSEVINNADRFDVNKITFFTLTDDETLIIPDTNLFTIYRKFLNPYVGTYLTSYAQRDKYRFRPHLLSTDLYGTPELYWMILMLNDQECSSKFRLKSYVKLVPLSDLNRVYDTIVTKSSDRLKRNWNEILTKIDTL